VGWTGNRPDARTTNSRNDNASRVMVGADVLHDKSVQPEAPPLLPKVVSTSAQQRDRTVLKKRAPKRPFSLRTKIGSVPAVPKTSVVVAPTGPAVVAGPVVVTRAAVVIRKSQIQRDRRIHVGRATIRI
jgi:hypothetical protein